MGGKMRQQTNAFIEGILNNQLSHYRNNCPRNITDLVFIEIEKNPTLRNQYDNLLRAGTANGYLNSTMTINQFIGRHVREYWSLQNGIRNNSPVSTLPKSYKEH